MLHEFEPTEKRSSKKRNIVEEDLSHIDTSNILPERAVRTRKQTQRLVDTTEWQNTWHELVVADLGSQEYEALHADIDMDSEWNSDATSQPDTPESDRDYVPKHTHSDDDLDEAAKPKRAKKYDAEQQTKSAKKKRQRDEDHTDTHKPRDSTKKRRTRDSEDTKTHNKEKSTRKRQHNEDETPNTRDIARQKPRKSAEKRKHRDNEDGDHNTQHTDKHKRIKKTKTRQPSEGEYDEYDAPNTYSTEKHKSIKATKKRRQRDERDATYTHARDQVNDDFEFAQKYTNHF